MSVNNPKHIAIIMDGNGRWAKSRGLPRMAGHKKGAEAVKEILNICITEQISYLTLYAFSSENWQRPEEEVNYLMDLLSYYLENELDSLHNNNVKLKIIGNLALLPDKIKNKIEVCLEKTKNNKAITLIIALSYGSREEILQAIKLAASDLNNGIITSINENNFSEYLYTKDIPDPDLLIRTSGEQRLSNFLLWQSAYTELFFTKILWPDFGAEDLKQALLEYHNRERRYGKS